MIFSASSSRTGSPFWTGVILPTAMFTSFCLSGAARDRKLGQGQPRSVTASFTANAAKLSAAFAFAVPSVALADSSTGQILPSCRAAAIEAQPRDTQEAVDMSYCLGLAGGVMAIMAWNCQSVGHGHRPSRTLTAGMPATNTAAVHSFVNWADDRPNEWGEDAAVVMVRAIRNGFECDPETYGENQ